MNSVNSTTVQNDIIDRADFLYRKAIEKYGYSRPFPKILFDIKGARLSGIANYSYNRIRFNIAIAEKNHDEFIERTVAHEMAHLVQRNIAPRAKSHGITWKNIMWFFGVEPSRCHSYDVSEVKPIIRKKGKKFQYTCGCVGQILDIGMTRHKRAQSGKKNYYCTKCRQLIKYTGRTS